MAENVQAHVRALEGKKKDLELQITQELKKPQPDTLFVQELKKKKLSLKEEIKSSS